MYGPGSSSGKALGYGLDSPGSIPGVGGGRDFSSLLRIQTGPGVHSASAGVKEAERISGSLQPHPPWAFMAYN